MLTWTILGETFGLDDSADVAATPVADAAWVQVLAQWRADGDKRLKAERGWLSIVSRDELTPGKYRIGTAPDNDVKLPKGIAPAYLGTIEVEKDKARLVLAKGQTMRTVVKGDPPPR